MERGGFRGCTARVFRLGSTLQRFPSRRVPRGRGFCIGMKNCYAPIGDFRGGGAKIIWWLVEESYTWAKITKQIEERTIVECNSNTCPPGSFRRPSIRRSRDRILLPYSSCYAIFGIEVSSYRPGFGPSFGYIPVPDMPCSRRSFLRRENPSRFGGSSNCNRSA